MALSTFKGKVQIGTAATAGGTPAVQGELDLIPTTASKGKLILKATANTGNTNTSITNAAMGQATALTIPDPGAASSSFVLADGASTLAGQRTFSTAIKVTPTTNQIVLGASAHLTTLSAAAPAAATQVVTVPDSGASTANFVLDAGTTTMAAGSQIKLDNTTATCSSNACTLSKQVGVVTTESLSTAGGASQDIVITNTLAASTSVVMVTRMGGSNTTANFSLTAVPTSSTITVTINNNTAATALNGTIKFSVAILN